MRGKGSSKGKGKFSRQQKRATLYEKLQLLRDTTNSSSVNRSSIVEDASKYIKGLKERVERLNQDIGSSQGNQLPMVRVETLDMGFFINVFVEKNRPGLLISIAEAFDELGLDVNVLDARVSPEDSFLLEAIGVEAQGQDNTIDAQTVKQSLLEAIESWNEGSNDEEE